MPEKINQNHFKLGQVIYIQSSKDEPKEHPFLILGYENEYVFGIQGTSQKDFFESKKMITLNKNDFPSLKKETYFNIEKIFRNHLQNGNLNLKTPQKQISFNIFKAIIKDVVAFNMINGNHEYLELIYTFTQSNEDYTKNLNYWNLSNGNLVKIKNEKYLIVNDNPFTKNTYWAFKFLDNPRQDGSFTYESTNNPFYISQLSRNKICIKLDKLFIIKNTARIFLYDSEWTNNNKESLSEHQLKEIYLKFIDNWFMHNNNLTPSDCFILNYIKSMQPNSWNLNQYQFLTYSLINKTEDIEIENKLINKQDKKGD